jgi:hypothetical protein
VQTRLIPALLVAPLLLLACGEDPAPADPIDGSVSGPADAGIDAGEADADTDPLPYETLIEAAWSLPEGQESYFCATKTLTEDVYIHAIRPVAPNGTHHTVVSLRSPSEPDNPGFECGVEFGQLYASGVGTKALVLPDGVGLVARKGQQVRLNLHLFNAGDGTLTGLSGIEVNRMPAEEVIHEASVSLYGTMALSIDPTNEPVTAVGVNPLTAGETIVALFPHMHQIGTHFATELLRGDEVITIWDRDYDFESQEFELVDPLVFQEGDQLRTTCTYVNDTGAHVGWGDSSDAEMCFSIVMSY